MNIDNVLLPYADSQPERLHITNHNIERIPLIVDPNTGLVTEEFQKFYDSIVYALTVEKQWERLYELTSTHLSADEFYNMLDGIGLSRTWKKFWSLSKHSRGIDIELNLSRFQSQYRNLLGGFSIMIYMIESSESDICNYPVLEIKRYTTELLFTYSQGEFRILSTFKPLTQLSPDETWK